MSHDERPARRRVTRLTNQGEESGFSLLEVVIALAILGIIMGPLAMSFITGLRTTRTSEAILGENRSAQQIASLWTRDVQNVEPAGVNAQEPCPSPDGSTLPEEQLVTFSWGTSASSGDPQSATWVVVGTGSSAKLERRACEAGMPTVRQVVADSFALSGEEASAVIRGPSVANPRQFCPRDGDNVGRTCTIVVDGRYNYHLSVDRRVPDARFAEVPPTPPGAPEITVAEPRRERINVAWTPPPLGPDQPEILGYRVHLYTDPDGEPIASQDVVDAEYSFLGLTNGTSYWVRVQARNVVGWGPMSLSAGPVVPTNTSPEAPTIVSAEPGDTAATVTITPNPNDGGSEVLLWRLYAELEDGTHVNFTVMAPGSGPTRTGVVPNLLNGQTYRLSASGINAHGEGPRSGQSDPVTPFGIPGQATITDLQSQPDGSIVLSWNEPTTPPPNSISTTGGRPITGYRILAVSGSPSGPWPESGLLGEGVRNHAITGLAPGATYSFVVETYNERGHSTSQPSAEGVSATPPGMPTSVVADPGVAGQVTLTWAAPPSDGGSAITSYQVTRTGATPQTLDASATSHTFTGLSSGTSYTFSVRAVNIVGEGPYASVNETALGTPSPVSVGVSRQAGNTYPFAVNVSWGPPTNRGGGCISEYRVEYSTNGSSVSGTQTLSTTPGPAPGCAGEPGTSIGWTGLTAGAQTRYFRVVATNTGGLSSTSGWATLQMTQLCTVPVLEDSYTNNSNPVFGSDQRGNNFGGSTQLQVRSGYNGYVKFNPRADGTACNQFGSPLPASAVVQSGAVRLWQAATSSGCRVHQVFRVTGNWTEYGITHNNQPGNTAGGGSICTNESTGNKAFSVSVADINQQRTGDRWGWVIREVNCTGVLGICLNDVHYHAREHGTAGQRPFLDIWFY